MISHPGFAVTTPWEYLHSPPVNRSSPVFKVHLPPFASHPQTQPDSYAILPLIMSPGGSKDCPNLQIIDQMCKSDMDPLY